MISNNGAVKSLYVWTQINNEPVIAGKFEQNNRVGTFYYAESYLKREDAFPLDPINLPLVNNKDFHTESNGGVFGALLDAGPDRWGQRVLAQLSPRKPKNSLEYLLAGNGDGVGSLLFSMSRNSIKIPNYKGHASDINQLEQAAQDLLKDEHLSPELKQMIMDNGSSMGGARPKATVLIDGVHYLAKFNRSNDLFNEARAEKASLDMARDAGIKVSDSRVIHNPVTGHDVLLTKRFDFNEKGHKKHYLSANSLLNLRKIRENDPGSGYPGLAEITRRFTKDPLESSIEVFKRMTFRVLLGDTDDHAKNYGYLYNVKEKHFEHSPMFDVLPHMNNIGNQALVVGEYGRQSSIKNILSMSESFGLKKNEAAQIIAEQAKIISQWRDYFRHAGISETEITIMSPCFSLVDEKEANLHY